MGITVYWDWENIYPIFFNSVLKCDKKESDLYNLCAENNNKHNKKSGIYAQKNVRSS